jgi:hypothetical protein
MTSKIEVNDLNLSWDTEYSTDVFLHSSQIHPKNAGPVLRLKQYVFLRRLLQLGFFHSRYHSSMNRVGHEKVARVRSIA